MKVRLPKHMPRRLADVLPNDEAQWQTATHLAMHGDEAQQLYARAWFGIAGPRLKPFAAEPIMA